MAPQILRPLSSLPTHGGSSSRSGSGYKYRPKHLLALLLLLPFFYLFSFSSSSAIPFHHSLGPPAGNTSFSPTPERQIPPYLHYVFGLSPNFGGKPFGFIQYLCFSSALGLLKPEVIYMHHVYPPTGWWWERWKKELEKTSTRLEMIEERDVTAVFGREVEHFAHKADVLRLEALRDYGGVYLDTDVMVIRDLAPLYKHAVVMGMESQPNLDPSLDPSGLCNAVVLSRPYSSFVMRWMESYRTFDKELWATHSVAKPWSLAKQFPLDLTILNKFAFFWPLWHDDHLRLVHRSTSYNFFQPDPFSPTNDKSFTYHLWESVAWDRYLKYYDPDRIHARGAKRGAEREEDGRSDESSFSRLARRWVSDELRIDWRRAVEEGLVELEM